MLRRSIPHSFAIIAATAAAGCTDPTHPTAYESISGYGFLLERDDQFHVVDATGRPIRTVLPSGVTGFMPDVSADGSIIVFIRPEPLGGGSHRLAVATIGVDGSGFVVVSSQAESSIRPRWMPQGGAIGYSMSSSGQPAAYFDDLVIRSLLPGGGLAHVIASPFDDARALTWSPSGDRIAFERGSRGVWAVNPDGSGLAQLTSSPDGKPDWSPDGTRLAFERTANGRRQACILVFATGAEQCFGVRGWGSNPRWSPAGNMLALIGDDGGLYTVDRDGGSLVSRVPGFRMQGTDYDWVKLPQ